MLLQVSDLFSVLKQINIDWYASSSRALMKLLPRFLEVSKVSDLRPASSGFLFFFPLKNNPKNFFLEPIESKLPTKYTVTPKYYYSI